MKKLNIRFLIILLASLIMTLSCSSSDSESDSGGLPPLGGEEAQLEGDWWAASIGDGARFDGAGGGYDLENNYPGYCFDTADPVSYRFDGTTFTVYEDGGMTTGTLTFHDADSATYLVEGQNIDFVRVSVTGNCK